jgi:hypothetical protein
MATAKVSQNGWTILTSPPPKQLVPGTNVYLNVRPGPSGDLLLYVASRFDQIVEDIDQARAAPIDDGAWNYRPIAGSTVISNHASATAVDLNWTKHPLGAIGTFSKNQVAAIQEILTETFGAVRWGGDYTGRKDEMHFEINTTPQGAAAAWTAVQRKKLESVVIPELGAIEMSDVVLPRRFAYKFAADGKTIIKSDSTAIIELTGEWPGGFLGIGNGSATVHTHWTISETAKVNELLILPEITYQDPKTHDQEWVRQNLIMLKHKHEADWVHLTSPQFGVSFGVVDNGFDWSTFPSDVKANLTYGPKQV